MVTPTGSFGERIIGQQLDILYDDVAIKVAMSAHDVYFSHFHTTRLGVLEQREKVCDGIRSKARAGVQLVTRSRE